MLFSAKFDRTATLPAIGYLLLMCFELILLTSTINPNFVYPETYFRYYPNRWIIWKAWWSDNSIFCKHTNLWLDFVLQTVWVRVCFTEHWCIIHCANCCGDSNSEEQFFVRWLKKVLIFFFISFRDVFASSLICHSCDICFLFVLVSLVSVFHFLLVLVCYLYY